MSCRLIGHLRSRALRVAWALEELGLDYALDPAAPQSETAFAHNASGKIPALVVEGVTLTDSVAIVTWLADRHGALTYPAGTLERGAAGRLHAIRGRRDRRAALTFGQVPLVLPEALRVPAIKATATVEFARAMELLGGKLGDREFVAGEQFTVPDIVLGIVPGPRGRASMRSPPRPPTMWRRRCASRGRTTSGWW